MALISCNNHFEGKSYFHWKSWFTDNLMTRFSEKIILNWKWHPYHFHWKWRLCKCSHGIFQWIKFCSIFVKLKFYCILWPTILWLVFTPICSTVVGRFFVLAEVIRTEARNKRSKAVSKLILSSKVGIVKWVLEWRCCCYCYCFKFHKKELKMMTLAELSWKWNNKIKLIGSLMSLLIIIYDFSFEIIWYI